MSRFVVATILAILVLSSCASNDDFAQDEASSPPPSLTESTNTTGDGDGGEDPGIGVDRGGATLRSESEVLAGSQCLDLGDETVQLGDVNDDSWAAWTGLELQSASSSEHLEVLPADGSPVLRQQFVPSSQGSERVTARGELGPATTYTMTQQVFLEPGFDWGRERQTGKLGFGLGGGAAPTGGETDPAGFTARFVWRGNDDGTARIAVYSYAADRTQNIPFGDDYDLDGFEVPIGEWFSLTMEVTTNTNIDAADGRVRAWANGNLALERSDIAWQTEGDTPVVDQLIYSTFYGGSGWRYAPEDTTHVQFGEVCWNSGFADS